MTQIDGFYAIYTSGGVQEYPANENIKSYITLDLVSKSVSDNTATIEVNVYFQHLTAAVPIVNATQSGNVVLNNVQTNFDWNPMDYAQSIGGQYIIPAGTLVKLYNGQLQVNYGSQTSDLTFDVSYYGNINPSGAFRYIRGSGDMTISKITNGRVKIDGAWNNAFCWIKNNDTWTKCIMWKKIDDEWKKGV